MLSAWAESNPLTSVIVPIRVMYCTNSGLRLTAVMRHCKEHAADPTTEISMGRIGTADETTHCIPTLVVLSSEWSNFVAAATLAVHSGTRNTYILFEAE